MAHDIAAAFLGPWRNQPPVWQVAAIIVAMIVAGVTLGTFWMLMDLVISDVWPEFKSVLVRFKCVRLRWAMKSALAEHVKAARIAEEESRAKRNRLELDAIVAQRFNR